MNLKVKNKKRMIAGVIAGVVVAAGLAGWAFLGSSGGKGDSGNVVYVDSVADICGLGSGNGLMDKFSGVVEPQKTWDIKLTSEKTVDEIFVKEGDEVKNGDKLFSYNTAEMEENLAQAEIDLERLGNEIEQTKQQIEELKKEKASASADSQLSYTTQINTAENDIKKKEYEQKSKKVEIEKLKKDIANAVVISDMAGVVKTINDANKDSSNMDMGMDSDVFMTVLALGDFRVKASVNEQNMSAIIEGESVTVRSRVDDTTWSGTLTSVDTEKPEKNENNGFYMGNSDGSSVENSSNYPFYVELENADGLMLGQHVYIEMNNGQDEKKEGIWLDSYYIIQEENQAYVWAANSRDKIEKREISLGEFDEALQKYEITDGLTEEDYIAFPDETIQAGAKAEKNVDMMEGMKGMDGMEGMGSMEGMDGMEGMKGMDGMEGMGSMEGMDGMEGMEGMDGMDGMEGMDGMDGMDVNSTPAFDEDIEDVEPLEQPAGQDKEMEEE